MASKGDGARAPARRPTGVEALLREVLVSQAGLSSKVEDMSSRLDTTQADARAACDLGNRISTILEEQNVIARFAEHKNETRGTVEALRQDVVLAIGNMRTELAEKTGRIDRLERDLQQREGARNLIGWLMKNTPIIIAAVSAFVAGLGLKGKLPG